VSEDPPRTKQAAGVGLLADPPRPEGQLALTRSSAAEASASGSGSSFVLFVLRKLASPMRAFAAFKLGGLGAYFASLFSGKLSVGWEAGRAYLEVLAADAATFQVAVSAGLICVLVLANLALMRAREHAGAARVAEIAGIIKDPNVSDAHKARLVEQIAQDR
jgi:hypothetical protein